jgi:hypothetical protein
MGPDGSALLLVALSISPVDAGRASGQEQSVAESDLVAELELRRDDADPELLMRLAAMKSSTAARALVTLYPRFASLWMRRESLRALGAFDGVAGAGQIALDHVATVAANADERELREAAFDTLSGCKELGAAYLAKIAELPVQDQVREKALQLLTASGGGDTAFFRKLYADEKLARKLRERAFEALAKSLEPGELVKEFRDSREGAIRRIALEALAARNAPGVGEFALDTLKQVNALATDRAAAAKVLAAAKGPKAADELIDVAQQQATTPEHVREAIADLLAAMNDEGVNRRLVGLVGKGKPHEQRFALLATRHLLKRDEKLMKKVRGHLDDKDAEVRRVAIRIVGEQQDSESAATLEKMLSKPKDPGDAPGIIPALSRIRAGDPKWEQRLLELASDPDRDRRNAALQALADGGDKKHVALFAERVAHPDWTTRLVALAALEELRDRDSLDAVVRQMQKEDGRMLVEFANVLFRLTGELHDVDAATWLKWWNATGKDMPLIGEEELAKRMEERERRRLKQTTQARFFGVKIESRDVTFVVDVSGSMGEQLERTIVDGRAATRMEVVKRELVKSLKALDSSALFNLITFNSAVSRWREGVAALDDKTRAQAVDHVEHLGSRGGTNIYDALQAAFADPRVDTIFLLTDGEPTAGAITDLALIREHVARWNETRRVRIHCVAVGSDFELLEWLAEDSGGTYVKYN